MRLCLDDICTPDTLNPDLGVQLLTLDKIYSSFVMQCGITFVTFIALLALQALPVDGKTSQNKHTQSLVIALVDFQEARCYFAGAI